MFLRLAVVPPFIFGPFTVGETPPGIVTTWQQGNWYEVDFTRTPTYLLPGWIKAFPVCIFFDRLLATELKYMTERECQSRVGRLPPMGVLQRGEALYTLLTDDGTNAEELLWESIKKTRLTYAAEEFAPRRLKTKRGVIVLSKSERMIDDWLYDHSIRAEYERGLNLSGTTITPDWYLPDVKVVLEHLGRLHDENYRKRWRQKKKAYDENGITVVTVSEDEIVDLDRCLTRKLRPYFPTLV